jgi:ferric-dicitrate binding protein FerR (iron transport regulator)
VPYLVSAVVVLALIAAGYLYFSVGDPSPETYATGKRRQSTLLLHDSSEVTLNYASELIVHDLRPGKPRRFSLIGEAYFRVRHNDTPFIVSTGYADVHVVGTEFNLRFREGRLEVAVIRGRVNVITPNGGNESSLLLSQNQMAVGERGEILHRVGDIPMSDFPGWLHGKLYLNKTSLRAACREIEMRFDVVINIEARDVHQEMTGVLEAPSAASALRALCELTGKRFTHNDQGYILY